MTEQQLLYFVATYVVFDIAGQVIRFLLQRRRLKTSRLKIGSEKFEGLHPGEGALAIKALGMGSELAEWVNDEHEFMPGSLADQLQRKCSEVFSFQQGVLKRIYRSHPEITIDESPNTSD